MQQIPPPTLETAPNWLRSVGERPVLIFKHSSTCINSRVAYQAFEGFLEAAGKNLPVDYFVIDVKGQRSLSQELAAVSGVRHESPQVLLIKNGMCVWTASHISVNETALERQIGKFVASPPLQQA